MKKFKTEEAAIEYAEEEIGKYEYEIVSINGKKTFLCATTLPLEEVIRSRVENILTNFVKLMGEDDEDVNKLDGISFIGAQVDEKMCKMIEKYLDFKILCAYQDF